MIIAIDLDGTTANVNDEFSYRLYRDGYGSLDLGSVENFKLEQNIEVPKNWVATQFADPCFWLNAKPFEDAWRYINKWFADGHDIHFVTLRWESARKPTERWLNEWDIPFNKVHMGGHHMSKIKTLNKIGAKLMIEDRFDEADYLANNWDGYSFLVHRSYNQGGTKATRVRDFSVIDDVMFGGGCIAE